MTVEYLSTEDILLLAELALGAPPRSPTWGSWIPQRIGPRQVRSDTVTKPAALLDSLQRSRPLVDGNKRMAWVATVTFCELNGLTRASRG